MVTPSPPDWNLIRAFLATAEEGSLSAAAKRLGLTQPTLSRQVAALEDDMAVMLFERLGRSLALTSAGQDLLIYARTMGEAAEGFARAATGQAQSVEGLVRITASDIYSAYVLPDAIETLRQRAPKLLIEVVAVNDIRDIMRREADIAIRHVRPEQPDLIARRIGEVQAHLYAARSYLTRRGIPKSLADCSAHDFVHFGEAARMVTFLRDLGIETREDSYPLGSQNGLVAWDMVRRGHGLAFMMTEVGSATPDMVQLLPGLAKINFPIWLTTHREIHTSRKIRLVFDVLAEVLTQKT